MIPYMLYRVTLGNDTLEVGDKISLDREGCLLLHSKLYGGWLTKEDTEEALIGMAVEPDLDWLNKNLERAQGEVAFYTKLLQEVEK